MRQEDARHPARGTQVIPPARKSQGKRARPLGRARFFSLQGFLQEKKRSSAFTTNLNFSFYKAFLWFAPKSEPLSAPGNRGFFVRDDAVVGILRFLFRKSSGGVFGRPIVWGKSRFANQKRKSKYRVAKRCGRTPFCVPLVRQGGR